MKVIRVDAYKCGVCGTVYLKEEMAKKCCEPKHCEYCGKEIPHNSWYLSCDECRIKHQYDHYKKMTYDEYKNEYPNCPVGYGESYPICDDIEELLEYIWDDTDDYEWNNLKYVFGYSTYNLGIDAEQVIASTEEDGYEDFEFDQKGVEEFTKFVEDWNKKYQKTVCVEADILIEVTAEMKRRIYYLI